MKVDPEDYQILLHDIKGVNLTVGFFLDTETFLYSICWNKVDVRVEQITITEMLHELPFTCNTQQLLIDDHLITGEVLDFRCELGSNESILVYCKIVINWN
jgi:hypothetical protein